MVGVACTFILFVFSWGLFNEWNKPEEPNKQFNSKNNKFSIKKKKEKKKKPRLF